MIITDPVSKANLLNDQFHPVFSQQIPMKLSSYCRYISGRFSRNPNDMPEIKVTENGVQKLLHRLSVSKAPELKSCITEESLCGTCTYTYSSFNASIQREFLPDVWKQANVTPITKMRQYYSFQLPSSFSYLYLL